jgi:hypothetical protein
MQHNSPESRAAAVMLSNFVRENPSVGVHINNLLAAEKRRARAKAAPELYAENQELRTTIRVLMEIKQQ